MWRLRALNRLIHQTRPRWRLPLFVRIIFGPGYLNPNGKEAPMLATIRQKAAEAAKAIVGLAMPIVLALVADVMADLSAAAATAIAAGATGLMVWLVPNRPPT